MFLTRDEEAILNGEYGEALEVAMSVLVKMGDMYNADRMIRIDNVHIDAASYATIYDAGLELCKFFFNRGASFKVPTTLNPAAIDFEKWEDLNIHSSVAEKQIKLAKIYLKMGAVPTWTCTPYQYNTNVRFGQNVAWGESNAVVFVNSVIGARTNRYGDLIDVCAAIIGKVPRFGLYLDENRRGDVLIRVNNLPFKSFSSADYASLGFLIGSLVGNKIPIIVGVPSNVTSDELKSLCASLATSGSVALCHICGVTPESPKICKPLYSSKQIQKITVDLNEVNQIKESLSTTGLMKPDIIALGCPHYSLEQLIRVANLIKGKKIKVGTELWIFTSRVVRFLASKIGVIDAIEEAGGRVIIDTCFLYLPVDEWGFRVLMTDSAKMAYYATGLTKMDVIFSDMEECIKIAVSGEG